MTTPTGGNGTDIVSLGIAVDATQPVMAVEALDKLGTATVKAVKSLDDLSNASQKNAKWMADANQTYQNKIQLLEAQWKAEQKAIDGEKEYTAAVEKTVVENTRFLSQLREMIVTFGMSKNELLAHTAAQLGAAEAATPLLAQLKALTTEYGAYGVVIKSVEQIERERIQAETTAQIVFQAFKRRTLAENAAMEESAASALAAQKARSIAENRAMEESAAISLAAFKKRTMAENRAAAIAEIEIIEAARIAAQEREMSAATAFAAFKKRTLAENRAEAMRILTEQEQAAVKLAEKQAMEEIKWNAMSVKTRIAELERLKAYQASGAIRPETIANQFSSAAIGDLNNYNQKLKDYKQGLDDIAASHKKGHSHANDFAGALNNINFSSSRARSELIVLAHEAVQGRFSRMPASMMVLGEYTNAASLAFTGMGIAMLTALLTFGLFVYETAKGISQVKGFNDALNRTNGISGMTVSNMNALAESVGKVHGNYKEAYEATRLLASSGKFTSEQVSMITKTVVDLEYAFGTKLHDSIKEFESLVTKGTKMGVNNILQVSKAVFDLTEKYGFMTTATLQHIVALEKEGKYREATALSLRELSAEGDRAAKAAEVYMGSIQRGWHAIKKLIGEVGQSMANIGKTNTAAQEVARIQASLKNPNMLPGVHNEASRLAAIAVATRELEVAQGKLNAENAKAAKAEQEGRKQQAGKRAVIERAQEDLRLMKKNTTELQDALERNKLATDEIIAANPNAYKSEAGQKYLKDREAALIRLHTRKEAKVPKGPKIGEDEDGRIAAELSNLDKEFERFKQATNRKEQLIKSGMQSERLTTEEGYKQLASIRDEEASALDKWNDKRISALDKFKLKKDAKLRADVANKFKDGKEDIAADREKDKTDKIDNELKAFEKLSDAIDKTNAKELDRLDKAIEKQRQHNEEIGKTAEQVQLARAERDSALAESNELEAQAIQNILDGGVAGLQLIDTDRDLYTKRLEYLNQVIAKQRELSKYEKAGAAAEAVSPAQYGKDADKAAKAWQSAGNTIAKSLTDSFGKGGKAAAAMFKSFAQGQAQQLELNKQLVQERAAATGLDDEIALKKEAQDKFNAQSARNQMNQYGDMAAGAAGFFDEQSKGYKALMTISQIFHAAELAMSIAELVPKATAAILNQGSGDPYTAFGRMAAMAAVVAGLGVAVGAIGSSGGGGKKAADVQRDQGTGGVFGDSSAKSDSIRKSIEQLTKNSVAELSYSSLMLNSLRGIEASMKGITNLVVRDGGIANGGNFNIQTGKPESHTIMQKLASLWGGTKTNMVDSGIQLGGSVNSLQSGAGYNQYASVDTTKKSWFGLSKKTTNNVDTQALNSEVSGQFGLLFTQLEESLKVAATGIGLNADSVSKALDTLVIETTSISLKDLKGEDLTDAINAVISKTMDTMAQAAFANFDQFRQVGEGYAETVMRVANETILVKEIYQALGKEMGRTGLDAVKMSQDLIKAAGGIDALVTNTKFFTDNFLSDREKVTPVMGALRKELTAMGMSHLTTVDMYKAQVQASLDGSDAGNKLYASLLRLAPAFDMVMDFEAERYNTQLDYQLKIAQLEKKDGDVRAIVVKQRTIELAKLDESLKPFQMRLWALEDETTALEGVQTAKDALNEAYERERDALRENIDSLKEWIDSLNSFRDGLLLSDKSTLTPEQKYAEAANQYQKTLDLAKTGDKDAQGKLQSAAEAFLTASQLVNSNDVKYVTDFNKVLSDIEKAKEWAQAEMDVAQASLNALELQVKGLIEVKEEVITVGKAIADLLAALAPKAPVGGSGTDGTLTPQGQVYYNNPGASNAALLAELQGVRQELATLREERKVGDNTTAASNIVGAKLVGKMTDDAITRTTNTNTYNQRFKLDTQLE